MNALEPVSGKKPGNVSQINGVEQYIQFLTSLLAPQRRLKVAIDVGHGAAAPEVAELLRTCSIVDLRVSGIEQVLRHLDEAITGGAKEHIDGLSVNFPQWWFAARGSQTEPVLRLTVGAVNREILEEQTKHLIGVINEVKAPVAPAECS